MPEGTPNAQMEDLLPIQAGPNTDSEYASPKHEKTEATQDSSAEELERKHSTRAQTQPYIDETFVSETNVSFECDENPEDMESDDAKTVYSDASHSTASRNDIYTSELAKDLFRHVSYSKQNGQITKRICSILPSLLKAFALKLGYYAQTQIHRDVMVHVHKNRK